MLLVSWPLPILNIQCLFGGFSRQSELLPYISAGLHSTFIVLTICLRYFEWLGDGSSEYLTLLLIGLTLGDILEIGVVRVDILQVLSERRQIKLLQELLELHLFLLQLEEELLSMTASLCTRSRSDVFLNAAPFLAVQLQSSQESEVLFLGPPAVLFGGGTRCGGIRVSAAGLLCHRPDCLYLVPQKLVRRAASVIAVVVACAILRLIERVHDEGSGLLNLSITSCFDNGLFHICSLLVAS